MILVLISVALGSTIITSSSDGSGLKLWQNPKDFSVSVTF